MATEFKNIRFPPGKFREITRFYSTKSLSDIISDLKEVMSSYICTYINLDFSPEKGIFIFNINYYPHIKEGRVNFKIELFKDPYEDNSILIEFLRKNGDSVYFIRFFQDVFFSLYTKGGYTPVDGTVIYRSSEPPLKNFPERKVYRQASIERKIRSVEGIAFFLKQKNLDSIFDCLTSIVNISYFDTFICDYVLSNYEELLDTSLVILEDIYYSEIGNSRFFKHIFRLYDDIKFEICRYILTFLDNIHTSSQINKEKLVLYLSTRGESFKKSLDILKRDVYRDIFTVSNGVLNLEKSTIPHKNCPRSVELIASLEKIL